MAKIYLIGDKKYSFEHISKALTEDVEYFQLRLKNVSDEEFLSEAMKYKEICQKRGIKFIINDNLKVAKKVDADGIHVGQGDDDISHCHRYFKDKIIGLSVHNIEEAKEANELGVDYIGVGAMFETTTKDNANVIGVSGLKEIVAVFDGEVVAIGGIDTTNFQEVYRGGADRLAVCSCVLASDRPEEVVKVLR